MTGFQLDVSKDDPDIAYLRLPCHPGRGKPGIVAKQVSLSEKIEGYKGPDIYLDFDNLGQLIGIEILG